MKQTRTQTRPTMRWDIELDDSRSRLVARWQLPPPRVHQATRCRHHRRPGGRPDA